MAMKRERSDGEKTPMERQDDAEYTLLAVSQQQGLVDEMA